MSTNIDALESMLEESRIVDYLDQHPDFFLRHKALLDRMAVPHQQRGVVSLFDVALERQRERLQELESEREILLANASRNEHIFRAYTDVYSAIFGANSFRVLWRILNQHFRENLRIPACALWLNQTKVKAKRFDRPYELDGALFQRICLYPMADQLVYFGRVTEGDREILFGRDSLVHSMVLLRLGEYGELGFLAFGHANAQHFQPGMDSLLLEQLGHFITLLIPQLARSCE